MVTGGVADQKDAGGVADLAAPVRPVGGDVEAGTMEDQPLWVPGWDVAVETACSPAWQVVGESVVSEVVGYSSVEPGERAPQWPPLIH